MLVDDLRPIVVLRSFWRQILGFSLWGVAAVLLYEWAQHADTAEIVAWTKPGIPFAAIGALGGALAIFLGFRNNSAYDRWWEARKIWGALVNDSRSWCRQVVSWVEPRADAEDPEESRDALVRELVHRHLAFVHGLALHLRKQPSLNDKVAEFVPASEAQRYLSVPNVITAIVIEQGKRVAQARESGQIEHFRHLAMDRMLTRLSDIQGQCERIKNTPLPRQYDSFPRWFVYVYGVLLPFGMVDALGWASVPMSVTITLLFVALEASGHVIEDPFENAVFDTPMTALSITIERDLRAAIGEEIPDAATPTRGVIL